MEYGHLGTADPDCGSLSPAGGSVAGGEASVITAALGAELDVFDEVRFGGVPASSVLHPNSAQLAATTPASATAGPVDVELVRDGEVLSAGPRPHAYR